MALHPTYASLYTGGGGLDYGFELALPGARPVLRVERDAAACAVLVSAMEAGRMAPCPLWTNARTLSGRAWRGRVDWVIGGPPCQPFSTAGKRRGPDDPRNLWPLTLRLVWDIQPMGCFFENVPSADSLWYIHETVIPGLRAMGYRVEAGLFTAAEVGAPHRRERIFILADTGAVSGQVPPTGGADGTSRVTTAGTGRTVGNADQPRLQGRGESDRQSAYKRPAWPPGPQDADAWAAVLKKRPDLAPAVESRVRDMADGVAGGRLELGRTDALRILGNGVVPATAALAFRTLYERMNG